MGRGRAPRVLQRGLTLLRPAVEALLAALLAPACVACAAPLARPLAGPVCVRCWAAIDPGGRYDGPLRAIIHAFKYDARRSLAAPLAALMRRRDAHLLDHAACIVPVPLHPLRRLRRGFNQASDLASHLDLPVVHALWRRSYTAPQARLTAAARHRNVRDAFCLSPWLRSGVRATLIEGRIVVVVDDVRTTGATLDACARVLADAGAREVRTMTVAHAVCHTSGGVGAGR